MRLLQNNWFALGASVAAVGFIASKWPTTVVEDLLFQALLLLILIYAFGLARKSLRFRLPVRIVFWSWFAVMCGVWPLKLWLLVNRVLFPEPFSGL